MRRCQEDMAGLRGGEGYKGEGCVAGLDVLGFVFFPARCFASPAWDVSHLCFG